uniref:ATP synthase complex subunit 8 n=1 Tax=Tineola bisselliella TaxID=93883 RepID=A0A076EFT5_TINBI|nr:ATP synthase F0 subunit 8 [Tineola bisselliella]
MPQMMPLNWFFLFFYFILFFMLFNILNYYIFKINNNNKLFLKNKNIKFFYWKW